MTARGLGWALLIAVLGGAGGYGLAVLLNDDDPALIDTAPVVAVSPSFPTDPPVVIKPDPPYPVLERGLPLHPVRVGSESFGVTVPVPKGWARTDTDLVESKWAPPGAPLNSYLLRVKIVSGLRLTIEEALEQRRTALESVVTDLAPRERRGRHVHSDLRQRRRTSASPSSDSCRWTARTPPSSRSPSSAGSRTARAQRPARPSLGGRDALSLG